MSQFTVHQIISESPFVSQGGTLYNIKMVGMLDGMLVQNASINAKTMGKYQPGETFECSVEQSPYGPKLKKITAPPAQAYVPQVQPQAPYTPPQQQPVAQQPSPAPQAPYNEPQARQQSIERQSSLAQAVARCTALANIYASQKKYKEAEEVLGGKHIVQVATYLRKYVDGQITVVMSPDEIAAALGYQEPASMPTYQGHDEINEDIEI